MTTLSLPADQKEPLQLKPWNVQDVRQIDVQFARQLDLTSDQLSAQAINPSDNLAIGDAVAVFSTPAGALSAASPAPDITVDSNKTLRFVVQAQEPGRARLEVSVNTANGQSYNPVFEFDVV